MLDKDHRADVIVVAVVHRVWARLIKLKLHEGRGVLFHMLSEARAVDYHRETDARVCTRSRKPTTHQTINSQLFKRKRKLGRV